MEVTSRPPLTRVRSLKIVHGVCPEIEVAEDFEAKRTLVARWARGSAAGCMNHPEWMNNPQFILSCPEPGPVGISLTQILTAGEPPATMGAYFFDARAFYGYQLGNKAAPFLAKLAFVNLETISATLNITTPGDYLMIPCTFEPGVERHFALDVDEGQATFAHARPWSVGTLPCQWTSQYSGGSMNCRTWVQNPTFHLTISGSEPCSVTLAVFVKERLDTRIGGYIFEDVKGDGVPTVFGIRANIPFVSGHGAVITLPALPPKQYIIMPCTEASNKLGTCYIGIPESPTKERCALKGPFFPSRR